MLTHTIFGRGEFLDYAHQYRGPLIGLAVSLLLALGGRVLRSPLLSAAAGGAGVLAGWYVLSGAPSVLSPHLLHERLPVLAAGALLFAVAALKMAAFRGLWPPLTVAALVCGWWLAGAPHTQAAVLAVWPVWAGIVAAVLALGWLMMGAAADPVRPTLAGFTMAAALHTVAAPWSWALLALVPALASLPALAVPQMGVLGVLPLAVDVAGVGSVADLAAGRLAHGGLRAADVAVLSPLLALWIMPHVAGRLRGIGRLGPIAGALVSGAIAVAVAWAVWRMRWR